MTVQIKKQHSKWTEKEIDYIKEHVGKIKISTMAKNLNRSEDAVILKLKRLGLGNMREQSGDITLGELARILKVDRNTVVNWQQRHGLPTTARVVRLKRKYHYVSVSEFWQWAEKNKDKIDFSIIEPYALLPQPAWFEELRISSEKVEKNYQPWTMQEHKKLALLLDKNYSYHTIAHELGRTPLSVERKVHRLRSTQIGVASR
ncbi:DNA-binding protein [Bacillus sp. HMF5848]|uniref:helix-turn-helix domain-containing protein n=1 Tax=Bacillus sp. HMF5848 TaxID=2495421 RepID=UPI000F77813C|nr:helix-turn-helix domain-containing protein [Bacillus sp. HMF5848]RSK28650.1 DNA-binding protein [Bacillus sp. HMF5848]